MPMKNIEIYYESIKQVYNQIQEWEDRPKPFRVRFLNTLIGISAVILGLSIIPIFPSILIFSGGQFGWKIGTFNLSNSTILTYALAWLFAIIFSFLLFLGAFWLDSKFDPQEEIKKRMAPYSLSAEQLAFIFAYEAYKELKIFFVSVDSTSKCNFAGRKERRAVVG